MAPTRQSRKIAIIGGSGNLGSSALQALVSQGIHQITAVARTESQSVFPAGVAVQKGSLTDETFLRSAFSGQDVVVIMLPPMQSEAQEPIIRAASAAGVRYILPNEYGSDPDAPLVSQLPMLAGKAQARALVETLGAASWIAFVNNPWYEYCMRMGAFGIDVKARKATLWDGGNTHILTTSLTRAGQALAELLALPEEKLAAYRNKPFYVSSWRVTQREILDAVIRADGSDRAAWDIVEVPVSEVVRQSDEQVAAGNFMAVMGKFFALHFSEGLGGDYSDKLSDVSAFEFTEEDFDAVTAEVVKSISS